MEMKRFLVLLVVLTLATLLVFGCTKNQNPTGYSSYGQQGQQQPYIGGGCGVAPVSDVGEVPLQVPDSSLAA